MPSATAFDDPYIRVATANPVIPATLHRHGVQTEAGPVVELDHVSVRYRVPTERVASLKEYTIRRFKRTIASREFWALREVSLELRRGVVLGIVGPNGAGKSTLLKVVARVLHPTVGRVRVVGRVAPLLELGAGFDPELTGRENVFLNGAVLGFTRRDITERFDRIVAFAGLREFIDAPMRTYSTGMVARLGFAVATDVQPDVLIVDEVLAVGDAEFQQKSAKRIAHFREQGTAIMLVSHNLAAVQAMCDHVVLLRRGQIMEAGSAADVVAGYQRSAGGGSTLDLEAWRRSPRKPVTRAEMAVCVGQARHGVSYTPPLPTGRFTDVPQTHWAAGWIEQFTAEGFVVGSGSGKCGPEDFVTRAQIAVVLLRAKHGAEYAPPRARGGLTDVPQTHWAAGWIEQFTAEGFAEIFDGNYYPDDLVTREELDGFLAKASLRPS